MALDYYYALPNSVTATGVICQLGTEDFTLPIGVIVAGTFTATVLVEVCFDPQAVSPTWIQFGSSLSAGGTVKVDIPCKAVRVRCSAYTSGTITAALAGARGTN